jgi:hypothetical protein
MSIYWAPDNDEPREGSEASRAFGREIASLIYVHEIPWDARALRALVRRIWTGARGPQRSYESSAARPAGNVTPDTGRTRHRVGVGA